MNQHSSAKGQVRYTVLFLTKWYPSEKDEVGIFIQKHAKAVAMYCNVNFVVVTSSESLPNTYQTSISTSNGFSEIFVQYKKSNSVFKILVNGYRYFNATWMGIKEAQSSLGVIDLVHVHVLNRPGLIALLIKKLKGIPYIITEHWTGYSSGEYRKGSSIKRWFTKQIVKNATAVTTVSNSLKKKMLSLGLDNKYSVIPNVIESVALPSPCNNDKVKIATVADLIDERKNVSGAIRAIANVVKTNSNIEYHIIGGGPDDAILRKLSDDLKLTDKYVFFHGLQSNAFVYDFISKSDFVIINSTIETFSVVAAEALVCGKPVIATRCGGPEEFITQENGILIDINNQGQLEKAIISMLDAYSNYNPKLLNQHVIEKFSYKAIGKQFYELYKANRN